MLFKRGEYLTHEGVKGNLLFVLLDGELMVEKSYREMKVG